MNYLRQATAVDIALGPFVDSTDGFTPENGLTISQADVRLKKNSGAWAQKNDANAATNEENGWYEVALNATDTDTVGILVIAVNEAGALPVWREFQVIEEVVYDRDYAAAATGIIGTAQSGDSFARLGAPAGASVSADVAAVQSDTNDIQTRLPAALVGGRMDASVGAMAADTLTASALAASAVAEIQSGLSTLDAAGVRAAVGLASANLDTQLDALPTNAELGAATANLDVAVSTRLAAASYTAPDNVSVAAIKTKTDQLAFGVANAVDTNITHVIGDPVQENGSTTTNWGGAP